MIKIYIDQGHNPSGFNTGAEGNGFYEQDITYEIGRRLYDLLAANPEFDPRLSRPTPETILGTTNSTSLVERVRQANTWGADIFLSLHTNAAANPNASGSEALVYSLSSGVAPELAEDILEELNLVTGLRNRGVIARPGLYVLRRTQMPAVLVEMGFISNRYDAELMAYSPQLFAEGIYRGILEYYDLD
ncbi:MAG: N-acetylmuramoyl-L-alanine amidase [Clostridia bacterium]|nr:N-acetylmuramoyl-L-alanine amidase [Clostridia bacterium]